MATAHDMPRSSAFYESALELVGEGLIAVDDAGRILWTNRVARETFGYDAAAMAGRDLAALIPPDESGGEAPLDALFHAARADTGRNGRHVRGRRADGSGVELLVKIGRHDKPGAEGFLIALRDVAIQIEYQRSLHYRSQYDFVTQLFNREGFMAAAEERMRRAEADGETMLAAILNVADIGKINHWIGYDAGDVALHEVGVRLRARYPGDSVLGRVDGNEFALLVPAGDAPRTMEAWAKEVGELGRNIDLGGRVLDVGFTGGAALSGEADRAAIETLYTHARTALREARIRRAETGGLCFYDRTISRRERIDRQLEDELVDALARDEFFLQYQPKVDMNRRVAGYEALLRWRPADGDLVPPSVFVPIAEANGTIRTIGAWVFQQCCQYAVAADLAGRGQRVAVNLSPRQLEQEGLPDMLAKIAADSGADPATIELEVTESCAVEDYTRGSGLLHRLKARGFTISLDDFGTGYSSLSALVHLPVDIIKIDRSLLPTDLDDDADARKLLTATIELGRAMGREVLVEGVETEAQFRLLAETGCDYAQGYYFGLPEAPSTATVEAAAGGLAHTG